MMLQNVPTKNPYGKFNIENLKPPFRETKSNLILETHLLPHELLPYVNV